MSTVNFYTNNKFIKDTSTGCWNWVACTNPKGYGYIKHKGKTRTAHRLSYELHIGTIPDGLHVLHKCDNPSCVNPGHLFLGTNQDNVDDKGSKGRLPNQVGSNNGNAKLTETDVRGIKQRLALRHPHKDIASTYGVDISVISAINTGRKWRHVTL